MMDAYASITPEQPEYHFQDHDRLDDHFELANHRFRLFWHEHQFTL